MHEKPHVYHPRPVYLPAGVKRGIFHNVDDNGHLLKEEDRAAYDYTTLFFDVFLSADKRTLICLGPPFVGMGQPRSVLWGEKNLKFTVFGPGSRNPKWLLSMVFVDMGPPGWQDCPSLTMHFEHFEVTLNINAAKVFARKTELVLTTLQKDDPLAWIEDWCAWHGRVHGVQRIIIYDNGSSAAYSLEELSQQLAKQEAEVFLVHWPFPYGPTYSGRNQFAQRGSLNHCRLCFGHLGKWFVSLDVDEYLYLNSTTPLQEYLNRPAFIPRPVIYVDSYRLYSSAKEDQGISPFDHCMRSPYREFGRLGKYIYQPGQIEINNVHGALGRPGTGFHFLHKLSMLWWQLWERNRLAGKIKELLMKTLAVKDSLFFFHLKSLEAPWKQEAAAETRARNLRPPRLIRDNRLRETARRAGLRR